jgi:hypothetical protein
MNATGTGGLLNATFGNAPDFLVGFCGVQRGLIPRVKVEGLQLVVLYAMAAIVLFVLPSTAFSG